MNHMKQNSDGFSSVNDGIVCDVTKCMYNDKNSNCTAEKIQVGPENAQSKTETACATFEHDGQQ